MPEHQPAHTVPSPERRGKDRHPTQIHTHTFTHSGHSSYLRLRLWTVLISIETTSSEPEASTPAEAVARCASPLRSRLFSCRMARTACATFALQ